jgi:hypothetical protein
MKTLSFNASKAKSSLQSFSGEKLMINDDDTASGNKRTTSAHSRSGTRKSSNESTSTNSTDGNAPPIYFTFLPNHMHSTVWFFI